MSRATEFKAAPHDVHEEDDEEEEEYPPLHISESPVRTSPTPMSPPHTTATSESRPDLRSDIIIPTQPLKSDSEDEITPRAVKHKQPRTVHHRVTSDDVSRHMDEVIEAVSRGDFSVTRGLSQSPPHPTGSVRKRQLTTSSSSDGGGVPVAKRSAGDTSVHGVNEMRSPPLSATSMDECAPSFILPMSGE